MNELNQIMEKYAVYYNVRHIFAEYKDGDTSLFLEFDDGERIYVN